MPLKTIFSIKSVFFLLGPTAFIITLLSDVQGLSADQQKMLGITLWMLVWWISEALPLPVTAMLPIILFPLTDLHSIKETTTSYAHPIIFLFMGGFIIALALEKWNLHKRISLNILRATGIKANHVIFGFMLSSFLLSMWISNTATTVMMLPIAISVTNFCLEKVQLPARKKNNFTLCVMLGIAYSASIGGFSTLIGTPPNVVFAGILNTNFQQEINFVDWFIIAFPLSFMIFLICYFSLLLVFPNKIGKFTEVGKIIHSELKKIGKIKNAEKKVLIVFASTVTLWISRGYISDYIPFVQLSDTLIAMAGALSLFMINTKSPTGQKVKILDWEDTSKMPWGILLLFGGGLALATGLYKAGFLDIIGTYVQSHGIEAGFLLIVLLITAVSMFATEVMSNVSLTTVYLPVVGSIALAFDINLLWLMIPATIATSCAFMFPMSTPPNAIVFASGKIKVYQMVKVGVFLNIISLTLLIIWTEWVIKNFFQ